MIVSFHCSDTQALFEGRRVKRFINIEAVALRKLQQLHAATSLDFLRVPQVISWKLLSAIDLARAIDVPPRRINEIVKGLRGITVDTALRLGAFFGTDAQSWVNLQSHYDTEVAREAMASTITRIKRFESAQV